MSDSPRDGLHEAAAIGFDRGADAYERARPSYPDEAVALIVDQLGIGAGTTVVDLAAGTGKLTRLLAPTGARIIAVEPVDGMRRELQSRMPDVEVLDGTAEAMPLDDASADALTVAQAFHWFDYERALREVCGVLRPGGAMAMVWNRRDESTPWVAQMSGVIDWHNRPISKYDSEDWPAIVAATGLYTPLERAELGWEQLIDRDTLRDRVYSVSYVATMEEAEQQRLGDAVVALVDDFPERFPLPYRTLVYWCRTLG